MIYPCADKLENWGNKYALVTLAAKRAKQIKSGAPKLIETDSVNPLTIALEEIAAGKITCRVPDFDAPPQTDLEPEVAQLLAIPEDKEEESEAQDAEPLTAAEPEAEASALEEDEELEEEDEELEEEEEEEDEEEEEEHDIWTEDIEETAVEVLAPVVEEDEEIAPEVDVDLEVEAPEDIPDVEPVPKPIGRRRAQPKPDLEDIDDVSEPEAESEEQEEDELF